MHAMIRKALVGTALVGATLTGGALGASLIGTASAQTNDTPATTTPSSSSDSTTAPADRPAPGPHTRDGKTETALSGDALEKATAAAKEAVPGGTVERAETDVDGASYEVHMTNADGERVTVLMDENFKVTSVEEGCPGGGPAAGAPAANANQ